MKRGNILRGRRLIIFAILAMGLSGMGNAYAAWTSELNIRTGMNTGSMDMIFKDGNEDSISVFYAGKNGERLEDIDAEYEKSEDGRSLKLGLASDIDISRLTEGEMLGISLALEPGENGSVNLLEESQADFEAEGEQLELEQAEAFALHEGEIYRDVEAVKAFSGELKFRLYKSVESDGEDNKVTLYLKLDNEENEALLNSLPESLEIKKAEGEEPEVYENYTDDGIVVMYGAGLPVLIEQSRPEAGEDRIFTLTVYAYWTDELSAELKANFLYKMNTEIQDGGEETEPAIPDGEVLDDVSKGEE